MAVRRKAAGSPSETLRAVERTLADGWPPGLSVFSGDEAYHLDRAQAAVLSALGGEDDSGFGRTIFDEDKVDVGRVVAAARSAGMFAERRVVFVRDVAILEGEPEPLVEFAGSPPAQSYLIVRAPVLDRRRKLHKALATAGRLFEFSREGVTPAAVRADLKRMADERGLKLDPRAAEFLTALTGGDYYRMVGELDKIGAWLGDRPKRVDAEIVREVAAGSGLLSGWEVADALLRRDRAGALAAARRLVDGGEEPIRMVGGLAWRARTMLQARAMKSAGAGERQIVQATRAWGYRDELLRALERYTLDELLAFPSRLLQADRTFKSRSIPPSAVLEHLVDGLTRGGRSRRG